MFLHGGPGGNSWSALKGLKALIEEYPGDFVAFDERNEGCSNFLPTTLPPFAYEDFRTRRIAMDAEFLRHKLYGIRPWRVFGQSRGSAILHYYLEMYPESLDAAYAEGFSALPPEESRGYTRSRTSAFARTAMAYLRKYPEDAAVLGEIRARLTMLAAWSGFEGRRYYGSEMVDIYGFDLVRVAAWDRLHDAIQGTKGDDGRVDPAKAHAFVAVHIPTDLFVAAGYIMGTFAQDFRFPDADELLALKSSPDVSRPPLSETRYLINVIAPFLNFAWPSGLDAVDYAKIRKFLEAHPNFQYHLFAGELDPIAPPEMYDYERKMLGPYVQFHPIPGAGHDAWWSQPAITRQVMAP